MTASLPIGHFRLSFQPLASGLVRRGDVEDLGKEGWGSSPPTLYTGKKGGSR